MSNKRTPVHSLALWFIRFICPKHLLEEIEGDLIQKFRREVALCNKGKDKIDMEYDTIFTSWNNSKK